MEKLDSKGYAAVNSEGVTGSEARRNTSRSIHLIQHVDHLSG